ncbi:MAG: ABC transporter substrate-binding protein, partial [Anaerolineae bacterium]
MLKRSWTIQLMVAMALVTAACAPAATPAPTQPPAATQPPQVAPTQPPPPTEPPPAERKVATFIWTQEFDTLNPYYSNKWFATITQQIWNAWAWEFDDNNEPFPVLVTEIPSADNGGISEDGTVITMKLRDDITWSDGEPITSDDFVFTHEMVVNPSNVVATTYPYDQIKSVEAPDESTVVVTFNEPFAP